MADTILVEQEKQVKKFKRDFEGWRELILTLNSVLLWEKQWYPAVIGVLNTSIFLIFWIWDPSVLTTISIFMLVANLADCLVPKLISTVYQSNWTGAKEKQFEQICKSLTNVCFEVKGLLWKCRELKSSKPKMYYTCIIAGLIILAWIGNEVNNLLLTYLIFNMVLFAPGALQHGIFDRYGSKISAHLAETINMFKTKFIDCKKEKEN
ncbi:ADP-ribosylation factor-like protein 6-interacting protein 1 [Chrysoperla carnea]|uniref:ADP-ribosylation factor-like protein 6-interacting protein 1 n=1 Tax=Chrysoperla carnea TaxID=189513 RepID=UPI001D05E586|nr:ADP-ribosylation factor-like protein 6-interacting protein 1 [Chrysoperla carnea]